MATADITTTRSNAAAAAAGIKSRATSDATQLETDGRKAAERIKADAVTSNQRIQDEADSAVTDIEATRVAAAISLGMTHVIAIVRITVEQAAAVTAIEATRDAARQQIQTAKQNAHKQLEHQLQQARTEIQTRRDMMLREVESASHADLGRLAKEVDQTVREMDQRAAVAQTQMHATADLACRKIRSQATTAITQMQTRARDAATSVATIATQARGDMHRTRDAATQRIHQRAKDAHDRIVTEGKHARTAARHAADEAIHSLATRAKSSIGRIHDEAAIAKSMTRMAGMNDALIGPFTLGRANDALDRMSPQDHARFARALAAAKTDEERAVLLKALVSGSPVSDVEWLGSQIQGKGHSWLLSQTTLTDPGEAGGGVQQQFETTCGSTTVEAMRGTYDPVWALRMHQHNPNMGDVDVTDPWHRNPNLAADQKALHNTPYTGSRGGDGGGKLTPRDDFTGGGRWVDDTLSAQSKHTGLKFSPLKNKGAVPPQEVIKTLDHNLDRGRVVPVLVGDTDQDRANAHYVLAMARRPRSDGYPGFEYQIHDPWEGSTTWTTDQEMREGKGDYADWPQVTNAEVPR
jgi:hypothetical protein